MRRVTIITGPTIGLRRDAEVLSLALHGTARCTTLALGGDRGHARWTRLRRLLDPWSTRSRHTPLVFMEHLHGNWMKTSRHNLWVPNLEWVDARSAALMPGCRQVWCKTRQAERVVGERGGRARFIGFSSADRLLPQVDKHFDRFLHVAGRSHLKGSAAVVSAWLAHPQWPVLTVVAQPIAFEPVAAPNIRYLTHVLDDAEIGALMNSHGVHLCCSEAEGFGHYIAEAMSTGALTITTDAPPMNEHLSPDEGVLVAAGAASALKWGTRYGVTAGGVAAAVDTVLAMAEADKAAMGRRARARYLRNREAFNLRVADALNDLEGPA